MPKAYSLDLRQRVARVVKIKIGFDGKYLEHLVQHFSVLRRQT
jgi:hypothetical protein